MKRLFYAALLVLAAYEILKIYFIMPMPGSQRIDSLDLAYFLHRWRWVFRGGLLLLVALSAPAAFQTRYKWLPTVAVVLVAAIAFVFNFQMKADRMFEQPKQLRLLPAGENQVSAERLVLGVAAGAEAKAYPIQFLAYHHQVRDSLNGQPILVSYCNVCRSGRVFSPTVQGHLETFRLVGMDHFNAMFEDATTGSWWRQATGEAVAGPLKGQALPELPSTQTTLAQWLALYPQSRVMQTDEAALPEYDSLARFERGASTGELTRTDSLSWQEKSWVVGVQTGGASKAYDWKRLQTERVINDIVGQQPIVLVLADDGKSFFAFERPAGAADFSSQHDTLRSGPQAWSLLGQPFDPATPPLPRLNAHQEFWHSWRTFHPATGRY